MLFLVAWHPPRRSRRRIDVPFESRPQVASGHYPVATRTTKSSKGCWWAHKSFHKFPRCHTFHKETHCHCLWVSARTTIERGTRLSPVSSAENFGVNIVSYVSRWANVEVIMGQLYIYCCRYFGRQEDKYHQIWKRVQASISGSWD